MSDSDNNNMDHLKMLYPGFVNQAMRSQEPVTDIREVGDYRRIYSAAQYDPDSGAVWRADIDADHHGEYDTTPTVSFAKSFLESNAESMQTWTEIATGRLGGPQKLEPWESLFTVFNAALDLYQRETPKTIPPVDGSTRHSTGGSK